MLGVPSGPLTLSHRDSKPVCSTMENKLQRCSRASNRVNSHAVGKLVAHYCPPDLAAGGDGNRQAAPERIGRIRPMRIKYRRGDITR